MKITMNHMQSSLIAAAIGATIGVLGVAGMFLYQTVFEQPQQKMRNSHFDDVNKRISELENKYQQLRAQQRQHRRKRTNTASKHASNDSTYTATLNDTDMDAFSTAGTDIADDEFFDCSDSEDTLENDVRTREAMNGLDSELSEIDRRIVSKEMLERDGYYTLQRLVESHPHNTEVIWRFAKACHDYSKVIDKADMKEKVITEGIAYCAYVLEKHLQTNADFHKWYAVLVGIYCDYLPVNEKILHAYKFRDHITIALELRPDDSSLHHLIGRFKFEMASLNWFQRKMAAALSSEPPSYTYEDAICSFQRAEELATTANLENRLFLGKSYIQLYSFEKGVYWFKQISEALAITDEELKIQAEAKELFERFS